MLSYAGVMIAVRNELRPKFLVGTT